MKKAIAIIVLLFVFSLIVYSISEISSKTRSTTHSSGISSKYTDSDSGSSYSNKSYSGSSFTNAYGTPTTKCAHAGCNKFIASSGDTNCCTIHSHHCQECGKYIDEDALFCISCLTKAANQVKKDKYGY